MILYSFFYSMHDDMEHSLVQVVPLRVNPTLHLQLQLAAVRREQGGCGEGSSVASNREHRKVQEGVYSLVQVVPLPVKPSLHLQFQLPSIFVQSAFSSQSSRFNSHSSISVDIRDRSLIKAWRGLAN